MRDVEIVKSNNQSQFRLYSDRHTLVLGTWIIILGLVQGGLELSVWHVSYSGCTIYEVVARPGMELELAGLGSLSR